MDIFTVRSLVLSEFSSLITEDQHYFCENPDCSTVYFCGSAENVIGKEMLKTRIGLKEKAAPRPVCYCFHYTVESIQDEICRTGESTAEKDISEKIKAGLCHCEDANPEGRCCLGNVTTVVAESFQSCELLMNHRQTLESIEACCGHPPSVTRAIMNDGFAQLPEKNRKPVKGGS